MPQTPEATAASGFYPGCAGVYEKLLDIPAEWAGQRVLAVFDGVYMQAAVSLNGSQLALHPYGYSPFVVDLTRRVRFGERNRLEVVADATAAPNCRWYPGAGIYREVKLVHGPWSASPTRGSASPQSPSTGTPPPSPPRCGWRTIPPPPSRAMWR